MKKNEELDKKIVNKFTSKIITSYMYKNIETTFKSYFIKCFKIFFC